MCITNQGYPETASQREALKTFSSVLDVISSLHKASTTRLMLMKPVRNLYVVPITSTITMLSSIYET